MPNKACAIFESLFFSTESKVAILSPLICPGVPEQPVLLAATICLFLGDLPEAYEGHGVVGTTLAGAAAGVISVIDDARDVVLDASVDAHGDGEDAMAEELFGVVGG